MNCSGLFFVHSSCLIIKVGYDETISVIVEQKKAKIQSTKSCMYRLFIHVCILAHVNMAHWECISWECLFVWSLWVLRDRAPKTITRKVTVRLGSTCLLTFDARLKCSLYVRVNTISLSNLVWLFRGSFHDRTIKLFASQRSLLQL